MLVEITLSAGDHSADALANALIEAGALSVSIEDADVGSEDESALYGEPGFESGGHAWARSRLHVLAERDDVDAMIAAASTATGVCLSIDQRVLLDDIDWVRATQAQFAPTRISDRLWVVPTWHQPPDESAVIVRLDPGTAFGTGTHPTTRLCLQWLDENLPAGASVLDYGCGSGILAIAAAKLGAARVLGVDIDPQAIETARANTSANGLSCPPGHPQDSSLPLGRTARSAQGASPYASYTDSHGLSQSATTFDVVLANILSNPLKLLAPAILARVAPRGSLVLSGILERQAEEVIAAYRLADPMLPLSVWRSKDGWVCLAGARATG